MKKILLVEDEDLFAKLVAKLLTELGYAVVRARNGKEALLRYDPHIVDLVLTDLIMPDMEGVELILALRKVHPGVKIIAMTGGGRNRPEAYLQVAQRLGAIRTLTKPFSTADLAQAVQVCLEQA